MNKEEIIKNLEEKVSEHFGVSIGGLCSRAPLALGGYPTGRLMWLGFELSITSFEEYDDLDKSHLDCLDIKFLDLGTGAMLTEVCRYNGNLILMSRESAPSEASIESVLRSVRSKVVWIRDE